VYNQEDMGIVLTGTEASLSNWWVRNLMVEGNRIYTTGDDGIVLGFQGTNQEDNVQVLNNSVHYPTGMGIHYHAGHDGVSNVSVSGNSIHDAGESGIVFEIDDESNPATAETVTIANNMVIGSGDHGIWYKFSTSNDANVQRSLMITNNICRDNGSTATEYGIYVIHRGTLQNFQLTSNILESNSGEGFRLYTGVSGEYDGGEGAAGVGGGPTTEGDINSMNVTGNTARNNDTSGGTLHDVTSGGTNLGSIGGVVTSNVHSYVSISGRWTDLVSATGTTGSNNVQA
jgi:hypothetical protein